MANLQRLIRNAVALLLGCLLGGALVYSGSAHALLFTVDSVNASGSPYGVEVAEGCRAGNAHLVGTQWEVANSTALATALRSAVRPGVTVSTATVDYAGTTTTTGSSVIVCTYVGTRKSNGSTFQITVNANYTYSYTSGTCETEVQPNGQCVTCPDGWTWNGSSCEPPECPLGEVWDGVQGACRMDCKLAASQPPSRSHVSQGGAVCLLGCKRTRGAVPGGSNCVMQIDVADGSGGLVCDYAWTGEQCDWTGEKGSGDDPVPTDPVEEDEGQPEKCGAGYVSGTVNGQQTCLLGGPPVDTTDKKTETKTNPDGTSETKQSTTETKVNPDGTVTTRTTTTIIVKDASGNVMGTDVESVVTTQGKDGYCEQNPDASVCGGGGAGRLAGACVPGGGVQELACEGDAIQCAIREQTMRTYCQLTASDEVVEEYEAIKAFDGTGEGEGLDRKEIEVPSALAVTEIGGGAGLHDQSFSVMGQTIEIPFSELNRFIEMFGYAIMMIAWLGAWRIIAEAF